MSSMIPYVDVASTVSFHAFGKPSGGRVVIAEVMVDEASSQTANEAYATRFTDLDTRQFNTMHLLGTS